MATCLEDGGADAAPPALDAEMEQPDAAGLDFDPRDLDPPLPPGEVHAEPDDEAAYLFDPSALRTSELRLSAEDLATLDASPRAEQYVEDNLIFEGQEYAAVGIRYRGTTRASTVSR